MPSECSGLGQGSANNHLTFKMLFTGLCFVVGAFSLYGTRGLDDGSRRRNLSITRNVI
jgi:hypothetical protein